MRYVVFQMQHLARAIEHLAKEISHCCGQNKPRIVRLLVVVRPAEPMKKEIKNMDPIELGQVPLGQRIPVDFTPDEPVDVKPDGNYVSVTVNTGDSTVLIAPGSTPLGWRVYFNGDGAIGQKSATVSADGHVGQGDVEIEQVVNWEVVSTDATTFTNVVGKLEPIPIA